MAVDLKKYLQELAQTTGVDTTALEGTLKVLEANPKFAEAVAAGVSRQDDYSRSMDTLTKARTEFEAQQNTWREWYKTAVENDAAREAELKTLREKAGAGGGGNGGAGGGGNGGGLTRKEAEELLATTRGQLIAVTKDMGAIVARHVAEFPKVAFDVAAIEKIAIDKGMTVAKAYDEWVRPQVDARDKADVEARIAAARAEGVKEGMSKHGIPDDAATSRGHHVLFDRPKADAVPDARTRAANFAEAWNTAATKPAA